MRKGHPVARRISGRVGVNDGWDEVERAEARLQARSEAREARERRRARRARIWSTIVHVLLPFAGAAVVAGVVELAGGDLARWPAGAATAFVVAAFAVPAAAAAWLRRRDGMLLALAAAGGTFGAQVALVFGVAFTALGLGPR